MFGSASIAGSALPILHTPTFPPPAFVEHRKQLALGPMSRRVADVFPPAPEQSLSHSWENELQRLKRHNQNTNTNSFRYRHEWHVIFNK